MPWRVSMRRVPPLLVAVLAYGVVRCVGLVVLALATPSGHHWWSLLGGFDGSHYLAVARHGYAAQAAQPSGAPTVASPAFFPLFPALVGIALRVLPGSDLVAGLVVAWGCGVLAAAALYRLGERLDGARSGIVLVVLWASLPHAVVGSMVYAENLFTALAAACLLLLLDRAWLAASACAVLAGLTRPTAAALVLAVVVAAIPALVRREGWRPAAACVVAPLGLLGYLGWVSVHLHRVDGYFWLQDTVWRTRWDGGRETVQTLGHVVTAVQPLAYVVSALVIVGTAVGLVLLALESRLAWSARMPLLVYGAVVLVLVVGARGYFWAKGRLLLPDVVVLVPVALAMARARRSQRWVLLGSSTLVSAAYGGYLLTVWTHSP